LKTEVTTEVRVQIRDDRFSLRDAIPAISNQKCRLYHFFPLGPQLASDKDYFDPTNRPIMVKLAAISQTPIMILAILGVGKHPVGKWQRPVWETR
jgi:hypothetical protein